MNRRILVNLATHPVERVRAARRIVNIVAVTLLVITVAHAAALAWASQEPEQDIAGVGLTIDPEQIAAWRVEVDRLAAVADVQRARAAAAAVEVGNELVGWRTISWRSIFADLEELLPRRVRLEVVAPSFAAGGGIEVQMTAAANGTGPLQDLMLALEAHPAFTEVWPQREDSGVDEFTRLTLRARYVPREASSS